MDDIRCILFAAAFPVSMWVLLLRQRRGLRMARRAERERFAAMEHEHNTPEPQTPKASRAAKGLVRDDKGNWHTVNAQATIIAHTVPAPHRPRQRSFEERCGQAICDVLAGASVAFQPYVSPRDSRPRPVKSLRTDTFFVILDKSNDLDKVLGLDEQLAMKAGIDAARVARYGAKIGIEFQLPAHLWQPLELDAPGTGGSMRLGRNTLNQAVHLDLANPSTPHALIAGTTGCGKTTLLQGMLYQLALGDPTQQQIVLIDSKAAPALRPFYRIPHLVAPPAVETADAERALSWVAAEIMRRRTASGPHPTLTVAIDEIALLMATASGARAPLTTILSVGREFGVHTIAATQKVTAAVLDGMLIANFSVRLAGAVTTANESLLATGMAGLRANRLTGLGDFIAVAAGKDIRFTAAMVSDAQLASLPRVEVVEDRTLGASVEALAMIETLTPRAGQAPLPTTPVQYASVLAMWVQSDGGAWPGIGRVAETLQVGKSRAERVRSDAQELADELDRAGVSLVVKD